MANRLEWLEDRRTNSDYFGPVLAGLAHFEVAEVHPFADYNGRAARLFAAAVLAREGVIDRYLFSSGALLRRGQGRLLRRPARRKARPARSTIGSSTTSAVLRKSSNALPSALQTSIVLPESLMRPSS